MQDRILLQIGEHPKTEDAIHIMCENRDAMMVVQILNDAGIEIVWSNSYGLSKPAKRKLEKLRGKYE